MPDGTTRGATVDTRRRATLVDATRGAMVDARPAPRHGWTQMRHEWTRVWWNAKHGATRVDARGRARRGATMNAETPRR